MPTTKKEPVHQEATAMLRADHKLVAELFEQDEKQPLHRQKEGTGQPELQEADSAHAD